LANASEVGFGLFSKTLGGENFGLAVALKPEFRSFIEYIKQH